MNRRDFFAILTKELRYIEPSELQDVLQYYHEYFDEAGVDNEQKVINELGSPYEIAAAIKGTAPQKHKSEQKSNEKKTWSIVLLACSAPITIPIAIVLAATVFVLFVSYVIVLLSFFISAIACGISGIGVLITSLFLIPLSPPTALLLLGASLAAIGFAILIWIPTFMLTKVSIKGIGSFFKNKILRKGVKYE